MSPFFKVALVFIFGVAVALLLLYLFQIYYGMMSGMM